MVRGAVAGVAALGLAFACSESTNDGALVTTSSGDGGGVQAGGNGGTAGSSTGDGGEPCPHVGPPLVDPSGFTPCPSCPGGHCIPTSLIPPESVGDLGDCDAENKCVPDELIETGGNFIPPTCESIAGFEGRCLSECLPAVAEQAAQLPQSTCEPGQRCAPCYDPFDGTATGACTQSCDPGPVEPPGMLPACCDGKGHCVPASVVPPDEAMQLELDVCPMDMLCLPDGFADGTFVAQPCTTGTISFIFGSEYEPGACLPDCLTAVDNFLIGQDDCPDGYKCAPCLEPPGGNPSGACDFLP
jgi:hypothetical protein